MTRGQSVFYMFAMIFEIASILNLSKLVLGPLQCAYDKKQDLTTAKKSTYSTVATITIESKTMYITSWECKRCFV